MRSFVFVSWRFISFSLSVPLL